MHAVMILSALAGGAALVGAWVVGGSGSLFGILQPQLYMNALLLEVVSISAGVCTLVRRQMEKENPSSVI